MIKKKKLTHVLSEVQSYKREINGIPFYPLADKLEGLTKLFNVNDTGNNDFIKAVNIDLVHVINWCIEECKNGYGKERWWIDLTLRQVKEYSSSAVYSDDADHRFR